MMDLEFRLIGSWIRRNWLALISLLLNSEVSLESVGMVTLSSRGHSNVFGRKTVFHRLALLAPVFQAEACNFSSFSYSKHNCKNQILLLYKDVIK